MVCAEMAFPVFMSLLLSHLPTSPILLVYPSLPEHAKPFHLIPLDGMPFSLKNVLQCFEILQAYKAHL